MDLREKILAKIEELEKKKNDTSVPSNYEIAISNLYIALSNTYLIK